MRTIRRIILHCAATRPEHNVTAAEIDRWHRERGWSGIGYHFLIQRGGKLEYGRPVPKVGAHVRGQNADSIGICLAGGHGSSADDRFEDHFTPEQFSTLKDLLAMLKHCFGDMDIQGHNLHAAKACPGFRVNGGAFIEQVSWSDNIEHS